MSWFQAAAAVMLTLHVASLAMADTITLRAAAESVGPQVLLRQVAQLDGEQAAALGDTVVGSLDKAGAAPITLTLSSLRHQLGDAGVNWAHFSLRGYAQCQVTRTAGEPTAAAGATGVTAPTASQADATTAAPGAGAVTNPSDEITLLTPLTLRERVIGLIEQFAGVGRDDLKIQFSDRDTQTLDQSALDDRFEFEPVSRSPLGRLPIVIRRYHEDRLVATYRVTAQVSQRVLAVVARRALDRGQTVGPQDVEVRQVYLDSAPAGVMTDLNAVVGQTVATAVRADTVLFDLHLHSPVLVRRNDLITVRCVSGGLVITTIGRAMADGSRDDLIEVRNERSRQTYSARVVDRKEVMMTLADPVHPEPLTAATAVTTDPGAPPVGKRSR